MKKGYYIHNQKKDASGVSKKIDDQMQELNKHFHVEELVLSASQEGWLKRKIRMKVLRKRAHLNYDEVLKKITSPDFIYIRKQIFDDDFFEFLKTIKSKYPRCKVYMELPTYPYVSELSDQIKKIEEKIIPKLREVIDYIFSYSEYKTIYGIEVINIENGINISRIRPVDRERNNETIDLIAVAKFRDVHNYERLLDSMCEYYNNGGNRDVVVHFVGNGDQVENYRRIVRENNIENRVKFYGFLSGDELDEAYNCADIAVGGMGGSSEEIKKGSALKTREYLAKGLPIIQGVPDINEELEREEFILQFPHDDSRVDFNKIVSFYDSVIMKKSKKELVGEIREFAKRVFSIESVMKLVIEAIEKNA